MRKLLQSTLLLLIAFALVANILFVVGLASEGAVSSRGETFAYLECSIAVVLLIAAFGTFTKMTKFHLVGAFGSSCAMLLFGYALFIIFRAALTMHIPLNEWKMSPFLWIVLFPFVLTFPALFLCVRSYKLGAPSFAKQRVG